MKPLDFRNYLFLSIKRLAPQIGLLMIKIMLFMFLTAIGFSIKYGIDNSLDYVLDEYISIEFNDDVSDEEQKVILDELSAQININRMFQGEVAAEGYGKLIVFNTIAWTIKTDPEQFEYVLNSIDAHIIDGRLPSKPGEIIISDDMQRAINKGIGQTVGQAEMLTSEFEIVGIYEGKTQNNVYLAYHLPSPSIYTIHIERADYDSAMTTLKQYQEFDVLLDRSFFLEMINSLVGLLTVIGVIVLIVVAIEATVSVSNLNRVYFSQRKEEFAILQAIGYSHRYVLKRLMKELFIISLGGVIGGVLLGTLSMTIFYSLYTFDKGIPYQIIVPGLYGYTIALTVLIFILSYIPTRRFIKRMDAIEVIQESNV